MCYIHICLCVYTYIYFLGLASEKATMHTFHNKYNTFIVSQTKMVNPGLGMVGAM